MNPHYGSYEDLSDAPYVVNHVPTIGYDNPDNHPIPELVIYRMKKRLEARKQARKRARTKRIGNLRKCLLTRRGLQLCKK